MILTVPDTVRTIAGLSDKPSAGVLSIGRPCAELYWTTRDDDSYLGPNVDSGPQGHCSGDRSPVRNYTAEVSGSGWINRSRDCGAVVLTSCSPGKKVAVFVDGCFWHSCAEHGTSPVANGAWWAEKLSGNVRRDRETDEYLRSQAWTVLRFWEHDPTEAAAATIYCEVRRAGDGHSRSVQRSRPS